MRRNNYTKNEHFSFSFLVHFSLQKMNFSLPLGRVNTFLSETGITRSGSEQSFHDGKNEKKTSGSIFGELPSRHD